MFVAECRWPIIKSHQIGNNNFFLADAEKYSSVLNNRLISVHLQVLTTYLGSVRSFLHSVSSSIFTAALYLRLPWACLDSADFLYCVTFIFTCLLHLAQKELRALGTLTIAWFFSKKDFQRFQLKHTFLYNRLHDMYKTSIFIEFNVNLSVSHNLPL